MRILRSLPRMHPKRSILLMRNLTHKQVVELFNYDPITGALTHRQKSARGSVGEEAGWVNSRGYHRVSIEGVEYAAHKVIWLLVTGTHPVTDIDHEDNNRANNAWKNLRPATRSQNLMNQGKRSNNASGYKGVTSRGNSHSVRFRSNGKVIHAGSYPSALEAAQAYDREVVKHQGQFAKTNKSLGLIP